MLLYPFPNRPRLTVLMFSRSNADESYVAPLPIFRFRSLRGASTVEFGLVILPLFAFLFLMLDTGWVIFARATLQHAVREGVRYGVTGQVSSSNSCLGSSVQQVVQQNAFGFIPLNQTTSMVTINYYNPSTLAQITGNTATAGGNVIQVSVSGLNVKAFAPIWRSSSPLSLSASASDVLESPPNGVLPCP